MGRTSVGKGKKLILFMLLAALVIAAIYLLSAAKAAADDDVYFAMSSNAERVEFLNKQGWIVSPDPLSKEEITIPSEFNELYEKYDEFQDEQGFDLDDYKGKKAIIYSYKVLNYPNYPENVTANLIVVNNRLVGGEITLNEENGFTVPLISESSQARLDDDDIDDD